MNFYDLMNKFKCDKTEDYTHVSMLPHGGLYKIPDEEMETFYGDYSRCIEKKAKFGILERPTDVGPMLVDVDIVKESKTLETLANYRECLYSGNPQTRSMCVIRIRRHELYSERITKVALCPKDDKRLILEDKISTLAIGHYSTRENCENWKKTIIFLLLYGIYSNIK